VPDIGTVWGNAYQRESKLLFTSTSLRRHAGMANGPGFVYLLDYSGSPENTPFVKMNLQGLSPNNIGVVAESGGLAIDMGSVCRNDIRGGTSNPQCVSDGTGLATDYSLSSNPNSPNVDLDAFSKVGMVSFGGIDLSEDDQTLWLVNLHQQALIRIDVSAVNKTDDAQFDASMKSSINQYLLANIAGVPACVKGIFRPWAITFQDGYGYLGGVCSAENEDQLINTAPHQTFPTVVQRRDNSNLSAHVLRFDPANIMAGFGEVVQFGLDHNREDSAASGAVGTWQPWAQEWADMANLSVNGSVYFSYAQPILGNIEFADDGSMILGFIDRLNFQLGHQNRIPLSGSTTNTQGSSAGDIIRVCLVGTSWVVEGMAASCPVNEPASADRRTDDGPSNQGEFFYSDYYTDHREIAQGGLAHLPGSGQIMSVVLDPLYIGTGGVRRFSSIDGSSSAADNYELFLGDYFEIRTFHKSNALGDIELLSDPAPIEIGNRVWMDHNNNGRQDPDELPIAGVSVTLHNSTGA
jgi:hypothetical protein